MELEEFAELGLTKNEGKAYEILIKFGKLSASEVSSRGGVSYSRIYDVLESLIQKGIVRVIPEKTKKFAPGDPEEFMKLIKNKEDSLKKLKNKVKELKASYDIKEKNPVLVAYGEKGFWKLEKETGKPKKYNYMIQWNSEYKPEMERYTKEKLKSGVDIKVLARYDKETEKNIKKWIKINKNIRKFGNEGVAIGFGDDEDILIGLIKSNTTILIKDKPFVKLMKRLFLSAYKDADKIR
ncbi:TrmB family transcriptional regulator [Candidatus Pacearchaeota archaeon]|nr:TrmB family transcriptional regulator [Candidatus Pacearchaeota archaeon]